MWSRLKNEIEWKLMVLESILYIKYGLRRMNKKVHEFVPPVRMLKYNSQIYTSYLCIFINTIDQKNLPRQQIYLLFGNTFLKIWCILIKIWCIFLFFQKNLAQKSSVLAENLVFLLTNLLATLISRSEKPGRPGGFYNSHLSFIFSGGKRRIKMFP